MVLYSFISQYIVWHKSLSQLRVVLFRIVGMTETLMLLKTSNISN